MTTGSEVLFVQRSKKRPRGKPFKQGERHPFQFKPGQSGNPGGKPKIHQRMSMEFDALLAKIAPLEVAESVGVPAGATWAEAIAQAVVARAAVGDVAAAREVREVTEGRVTEKHEVAGQNGQPLQPVSLIVEFVDRELRQETTVEKVRR